MRDERTCFLSLLNNENELKRQESSLKSGITGSWNLDSRVYSIPHRFCSKSQDILVPQEPFVSFSHVVFRPRDQRNERLWGQGRNTVQKVLQSRFPVVVHFCARRLRVVVKCACADWLIKKGCAGQIANAGPVARLSIGLQ